MNQISRRIDYRPVTLHDVAQEVGLSTGTVSRALNRPERLRPTTVARIRDAAERLGYRPNLAAQYLKTGSTRSVYVVIPSLNPFFFEIFSGIERAALEMGYTAIVGHSGRDPAQEAAYLAEVARGRADGVLLLGAGRIEFTPMQFEKAPPTVAVLDFVEGQDFPAVRIDHVQAARLAVDYLVGLGHRHIAHITGNTGAPCAGRRREGFIAVMEEAGLKSAEENCVPGEYSIEAGEVAMEMLLARAQVPTAVFAGNDEIAIGAIRAIRAAGLRVPEDISVIGCGDNRIGRVYHPALTTVHIPTFELGYQAMKKLECILSGRPFEQDAVLPIHIVERETTVLLRSEAGAQKRG